MPDDVTFRLSTDDERAGPAAAVLARVLRQRADVEARVVATAQAQLQLGIQPGIGREGFRIESAGNAVRVLGDDAVGLLHGVGQVLRAGDWRAGSFALGDWRGSSAPACPVRAMYCAFNFDNWYVSSPVDEIVRYAEELGLWGINTVFFGLLAVSPADAAAFAARRDLNRQLFSAIKRTGMKVGLLCAPNVGFPDPPAAALAPTFPDTDPPLRGYAGQRVCPSQPQGRAYLQRMLRLYLGGYEDIGIDYFTAFPYDAGGCGCSECWPWGARGFVTVARDFAAIARQLYPASRFILGTWCFDVRETSDNEFAGLDKVLRETPGWTDFIMADAHGDFPRYPLDHGVPGDLPLVNFPEISMWGRFPWGGFGANPLPARCQRLWDQVKHLSSGGLPYSEGIFEDINKIIYSRFYWDPEARAKDTIRDYIAYEYSPDVVDIVSRAVTLFERNWPRANWLPEEVERAYRLILEADELLPPRRRAAWRWRILHLRAVIDYELATKPGAAHSDRCDAAFEELITIYRAERSGRPDTPPSRRAQQRFAQAAAERPPGAENL